MYRFRSLKVPHLVYFEPQKYKSGPEVANYGQHSKLPGAISELPSGLSLCRDNGTNTDGAWELRMHPPTCPRLT